MAAQAQQTADGSTASSPAQIYADALIALDGCKEGEHVNATCADKVMAKIRDVAASGHVAAQFFLGSTLFSWRFQRGGPDPTSAEDKEAYIDLLSWLAMAIKQEHPDSYGYLPSGISQTLRTGKAPEILEEPMSDFPKDWLIEASRRADQRLVDMPPR